MYERVGGHAYGSVYPGPIGAVISPQLTGVADNPSLPYASTLCGACYDVCPVEINIPQVLIHLRQASVDAKRGRISAERAAFGAMSWVMRDRRRYAAALRAARRGSAPLRRVRGGRPLRRLPWPLSAWSAARDAPLPAAETFHDWWRRTHGDG